MIDSTKEMICPYCRRRVRRRVDGVIARHVRYPSVGGYRGIPCDASLRRSDDAAYAARAPALVAVEDARLAVAHKVKLLKQGRAVVRTMTAELPAVRETLADAEAALAALDVASRPEGTP